MFLGSVANAEFFNDGGIPQSAMFQISNRFRTAMKLKLIVGGGLHQQLSGSRGAGPQCQFLLQMRNTLAERHMEEEFHKPNQLLLNSSPEVLTCPKCGSCNHGGVGSPAGGMHLLLWDEALP